jgi:putative membrane protein
MMIILFTCLASVIHFYIFAMESLLWGKPRINKVFGMSPEAAAQNRLFAFNQGFYNLFLALAAAAGVAFFIADSSSLIGTTLIVYSLGSMVGASIVLFCSEKKLVRAALIQGIPPLLGLLAISVRWI